MSTQSEQINEIVAAMVKVQGMIGPAVKGKANPFFKSKYADLSEVWESCRAALQENGIAVIQGALVVDGKPCMETKLVHTSGQWFSSLWEMMPAKSDPQAMGSAITYMRRYSLAAMVGILSEDDDGNAASKAMPKADLNPRSDQRMADDIGKYVGKTGPALIPVPDIEPADKRWRAWGNSLTTALKASKAPEEVAAWVVKNAVPLKNLGKFSAKAHDHIMGVAEAKKDALKAEAGLDTTAAG